MSSLCREPSPTRTLKWPGRNRVQITSSAYHVEHVVLRATWYERTAQLLSLTELKSHLLELYFLAEALTDEGGEYDSTRNNPHGESENRLSLPLITEAVQTRVCWLVA